MLCPKGVKRYLQQSASRPAALTPTRRHGELIIGGFRPIPYEAAIQRRGRAAIERIQHARMGRNAFAVLSGASLTTEKTYLMGKFAHMCLRTSNIDYNGRLCMVSAAGGNKKAFGIDRAANPTRSDMLGAEVIMVCGANVAECAPDHHQLRVAGPRAGREGHRHRSAHHADGADVRPVPAGEARAGTPRFSTASCT
jgi:assimilatory nitrate reductase catalytic subunit